MTSVVVRYEKVLSRKNNGLTIPNRIRFDSETEASFWVSTVAKLDQNKTLKNFQLEKIYA
jgi:hypothetical protein